MGQRSFYLEGLIAISAVILISFGLITLLSIDTNLFYPQLLSAVVGFILFLLFTRIDFALYQYFKSWLLGGSIILLLLSFLGPVVRGSTRWIEIFGLRMQPTEFVKPLFLLYTASFLIQYPPTSIKRVGIHFGLFTLIFLIIFRQPDLGSAIVYSCMWVGMMVMAGLPLRYIVGASILFGGLLPVFHGFLKDYQRQRIAIFLNPFIDPRGAGYNALQSMISVGSGQLFGRGFGRGTQSLLRFLPERHTDFIFATFTEEFGFVGSLVLLLVFFILFWRILKAVNRRSVDQFAFLYGAGYFMQLFAHVVINVGMNIGVVPITGITLTFVSYGGSSLIATWIGLGIFVASLQKPRGE